MDGTQMQPLTSLCVQGEMVVYKAQALKESLLPALGNAAGLQLDMSGVTELDTAGLQLLILLKREADEAKKTIKLKNCSVPAMEVFRLCNIQFD